MPTSSLRPAMLGSPISLAFPASYQQNDPLLSAMSHQACGDDLSALGSTFGSQTYPASSRVLAFPFEIADPYLVRKVWWGNGTTATTDSADVGVYDEAGTTLLVSGGSTAIATANVIQEKDCTDTLLPEGRYWCAYIQGGVTATPLGWTTSAGPLRCAGLAQMAGSGSTLGATFTPAAIAGVVFPWFGIANRTQVA